MGQTALTLRGQSDLVPRACAGQRLEGRRLWDVIKARTCLPAGRSTKGSEERRHIVKYF